MSGVLRRKKTETRGYDTASVAVPPEVVGYRMTWMIRATTKATTSAKSPRISADALCGSATRILRRRYGAASKPASNDLCFATLSPLQELRSSLITFDFVTATGLLILTNSRADSIGDQYMRVENSISAVDDLFERTLRGLLHHEHRLILHTEHSVPEVSGFGGDRDHTSRNNVWRWTCRNVGSG